MYWFIPSFSGDLRLEPSEKNPQETRLTIVSPTAAEKKVLDAIQVEAVKRGWIADSVRAERGGFFWRKKFVTLKAPVTVVGPIVAKLMRPGPAVLTAITFSNGQMITTNGGVVELQEAVRHIVERETNPSKLFAEAAEDFIKAALAGICSEFERRVKEKL